jgi:xanthine dehydrogenase YagS FAD-binding subunit
MKNFEYAQPQNLPELLDLLSPESGKTELLGGGTDLVGLMKKMIVTPDRVVNVCDVAELQGIERSGSSGDLLLGAAVRLDELLADPQLEPFGALKDAIRGTASRQFQAQSTLGGELLRRPRCWYFRDGHGLLADDGKMIIDGDNRSHAILGNSGPAKFVNASRLAPALIALGAKALLIGPTLEDRRELLLEDLYRTPVQEGERENVLGPHEVLTRVILPTRPNVTSATYEVRHGEGPNEPLAAAAAALQLEGNIVRGAKVALGHVAPTPWVAAEAAREIIGQPITDYVAQAAGRTAVALATPLKDNEYKIQVTKVAVSRAILQAARLPTGGFYA